MLSTPSYFLPKRCWKISFSQSFWLLMNWPWCPGDSSIGVAKMLQNGWGRLFLMWVGFPAVSVGSRSSSFPVSHQIKSEFKSGAGKKQSEHAKQCDCRMSFLYFDCIVFWGCLHVHDKQQTMQLLSYLLRGHLLCRVLFVFFKWNQSAESPQTTQCFSSQSNLQETVWGGQLWWNAMKVKGHKNIEKPQGLGGDKRLLARHKP